MRKIELLFLTSILLGAFLARLYQFHRPIADWHSWRQVDTSSVSRNFIKNGFDVLHPKFDDLSKGVSLIDNPKGYRFVEFPIYNVAQAGLYKAFNHFTIEEWGRIVTILSQLISIIFIYLIMKHYTNSRAGIVASFFYAFAPYNIYWGRTILPDSTTVTAILGSIYFFGRWIEKENNANDLILALLFTISAFLLKPYGLFFMLPHAYLAINKFGFDIRKYWKVTLFLLVSIAPFVFWRLWMQQYPEGIPQSNWLFNGTDIRFKGAFFQWLFADRIGREILGYYGLPFVILGLIAKNKKEGLLYYSLLISCLLYMFIIATGNVQHDYYQILIIPTLAIFFGKGIDFILTQTNSLFNKYVSYLTITISVLFMIAFSWYLVRDFYNLQHNEVIEGGMRIDKAIPKNAKVVAPYGGDTTFLYAINRSGWPVFDRPLKQFIKEGAGYMAFAKPGQSELEFIKYFKVVDRGTEFIIFDLSKPTPAGVELINKK